MKSKNQDTLDFMRNIIGEEKFLEVAAALAGERVSFPIGFQWMNKSERNESILDDFFAGKDIGALAKKYDLSESHIYKIIEGQY